MARTTKIVEDRREQILDAAMRVFSQKGFARATNKDIAREAGITPGLIYHYFESKEAVLRALIEARSPLNLIKTLPPEMLAMAPEAFLRFILRNVFRILEDEKFKQFIRMFLPEAIHNPELAPLVFEVFQTVRGFLQSYFATKIDSGELRQTDAALPAHVFMSCVMGFILRRQLVQEPSALRYTHEQLVEMIVTTVLEGLLPR